MHSVSKVGLRTATRRSAARFSTALKQEAMPLAEDVQRAINLSAGCAALPLPVLEKAQRDFVQFRGRDNKPRGLSVTEMGYRTKDFYELMHDAESSFRELMSIPDTHEVHFFNGGATLQFAAVPMNLLGKTGHYATQDRSGGVYKIANYVRSGHWSEKARDEARMYCHVHETNTDPTDLYFSVPEGKDWSIDPRGAYIHYTAADTRQGMEFQEFPYEAIPEGMPLVCDASANLGSKPVDVSKYAVLYAAAHKNFSTSGVCYSIIRKDLISPDVLPGTPTMCNWNRFQTAPGKVWTVPITFSVWLGKLTTEWMLEQGGLPFFEDLAIRRSNMLYNYIDDSDGFYRTFVTQEKFRSRMQVVFTIRNGEGKNADLVETFLREASDDLGWLDIRSHPLGIPSEAIRVTMYNPQTEHTVAQVREFMADFKKRHF